MRQLIISNNDKQILVNLESNTILPGSYVNAEYNIPDDYKILQLERVSNEIIKAEVGSQDNAIVYRTNTKIISTYEDVVEHFAPAPDKYFITGVTESKSQLISKYFNKSDFINTDDAIKTQKKLEYKKIVGDDTNAALIQAQNLNGNNIIRNKIKLDVPGLDIIVMIISENSSGPIEYILYLDTPNPIKYIDLGGGLTRFMYMRSHNDNNTTANMVLYDSIIEEPKVISEVFIDRGINSAFERTKKLKNIKDINELGKVGLGYYKINTKGYNFKTR